MTGVDQAAQPSCEHYWAYHVHGGLSVRLCQLCHWPDWDDLRGQLGEAERKGALAERERIIQGAEEEKTILHRPGLGTGPAHDCRVEVIGMGKLRALLGDTP